MKLALESVGSGAANSGRSRLSAGAFLGLLLTAALHAQTFHPLHVSAQGMILDDTGEPVLLRGLNRSGTGSGTADAAATDADYAAQNNLLSMNVVRIFVNATWWNNNVQVPIAAQPYQTYIDGLIQRAKKHGNYALILKAGNFPEPPCGASLQNCPASNQGDLDCQSTPSACTTEDTTGNNIDAAFSFWASFTAKYANDPAVLYDTWEDMHSINMYTWSDDQNALIAAIRTYSPQSLIFVEDTGTVFESIASGALADLAFGNIVWNFHLYAGPSGACTTAASPRYANWPQKMDPLVAYAQQNGHAVAFTEWGGCNDSEPYHTNITTYAETHSIALVYFDSSYLLTASDTLTATGSKVASAYTAIAALSSAAPPVISKVANAEGEALTIAPNTWVEIKGAGLAPAGDIRIWHGGTDFFGNLMPQQLDGVSATVNGKSAYVYYISPTQVNILTPPDAILGPVQVVVNNNGATSAPATVSSQALSPSFFIASGPYVLAQHGADSSLVGPTSLYPGSSTPAKPGEIVVLYANGFGLVSQAVVSGSIMQTGTLSPLPAVTIGGINAAVQFAGLVSPGLFQFNVVVPATAPSGDNALVATYNGAATQSGVLITVQH